MFVLFKDRLFLMACRLTLLISSNTKKEVFLPLYIVGFLLIKLCSIRSIFTLIYIVGEEKFSETMLCLKLTATCVLFLSTRHHL